MRIFQYSKCNFWLQNLDFWHENSNIWYISGFNIQYYLRNLATKSQSVDQQYFVKDQFLNKIMCFDPVWYDDLVSRAGWKGGSSKILENDYKTPFSVVLGCKYWTIKSSASVFKRDPLLNKWAMLEVLYFAKWVKKRCLKKCTKLIK